MEHTTSYFDLLDAYSILCILLLLPSKTDLYNAYKSYQIIQYALDVNATKITNDDELESAIKQNDVTLLVLYIATHDDCKTVCDYCCEYGSLECLKIAHRFECPWNWRTCEIAVKCGQLECLKYAY